MASKRLAAVSALPWRVMRGRSRCRRRRFDAHTSIGRDRARPASPAGSAGRRGAAARRVGVRSGRHRGARRRRRRAPAQHSPAGAAPPGSSTWPAMPLHGPPAADWRRFPGPQAPPGGRGRASGRPIRPSSALNLPSMPTCRAVRSFRQPDRPADQPRTALRRASPGSSTCSACPICIGSGEPPGRVVFTRRARGPGAGSATSGKRPFCQTRAPARPARGLYTKAGDRTVLPDRIAFDWIAPA